jgi:CheY-like chemotaxis protein
MKILIIDDEEMSLIALAKVLTDQKYIVIKSLDGVRALKIVADEKIDLIISDILMPCISGFTFITMLRNFYLSKVPVILMSVYSGKKMEDEAYSSGANAFISKPINASKLFRKIKELVRG